MGQLKECLIPYTQKMLDVSKSELITTQQPIIS